MRRRLILAGVLAAVLASCGGSASTASPAGSPGASTAGASDAGASSSSAAAGSSAPSSAPAESSAAPATTTSAICNGVSLRKSPSTAAAAAKTINSGTSVHAVATVAGTSYTAGSCGVSGSTWLKIDKVDGKGVKAKYGVPYLYAAAGFFQ